MTDLLEQELARLVRLHAVGGPRGALARRPPRLVVREAKREKHLLGFADHGKHEIVVILHAGTDLARARETLLHEVVHLSGLARHDRAFKHALINAANEAWDIDVSVYEHGRYKILDRAIEHALRWRPFWAGVRWLRATVTSLVWTSAPSRATP